MPLPPAAQLATAHEPPAADAREDAALCRGCREELRSPGEFSPGIEMRHNHCGGLLYLTAEPFTGRLVLACESCSDEYYVDVGQRRPKGEAGEAWTQQELPLGLKWSHTPLPDSLPRQVQDQLEYEFARTWAQTADTGGALGNILGPSQWPSGVPEAFHRVDQKVATVAATLMQWLGTNCGFSFLGRALEQAGWQIVKNPGVLELDRQRYDCPWCAKYVPSRVKRVGFDARYLQWVRYHHTLEGAPLCPWIETRLAAEKQVRAERHEAEQVLAGLKV